MMRMSKLPPQEVILVWVFVKYFHFQLLTRYFMDNHLAHTHIYTHTNGQTHKYMGIWTNIDRAKQQDNTGTCKMNCTFSPDIMFMCWDRGFWLLIIYN